MFSDKNNKNDKIQEMKEKIKKRKDSLPLIFADFCEKTEDILWKKKTEQAFMTVAEETGENLVAAIYLAGKPEENLEPLLERWENIREFHKDAVSSALLAASYYGMEELKMRLPRLEEILKNPFGDGTGMHSIAGTILIADGGPAEGAKAMQLYFGLAKEKIDVKDLRVVRMIGLLAVIGNRPVDVTAEILASCTARETDEFLMAACCWMEEQVASEEKVAQMNLTAQNLVTGMPQELAAIVAGCLLGER